MRCESFEEIVADLDRPGALDGTERKRGLDHAAGCLRCARTLAVARALSADLEALAASTERAAPPPYLERLLRARQAWAWRSIAAAALLALAVAGGGYLLRQPRVAPPTPGSADVTGQLEFIPLGPGELTELDGATLVVRIQVSDGGLGLLEADLLLGEDGVARAIRFVE